MLEYNEIRQRKFIVFENEPYEVLDSHVFRKQQRKPVNQVKMRNVISGRIVEHSFHQSDKANEAEIGKRQIKYLYENRGQYWFCNTDNQSQRFSLTAEQVGAGIKFIKQNSVIDLDTYEDKILGIEPPIKVELKVIEAPPAIRGDTVTGGNKQATLETGAVVNVPMFIKEGDTIRVNTETGDYVERV